MPNLTLTRTIAAPAEVVFETITDHAAYPSFTPIRRAELEREGEDAPNGVGAIRALHVAGPPIRERVTVYDPPRQFAYEVLSGVPVKRQVGTVTLQPDGAGCVMRYELEIEPRLAITGPLAAAITRVAISRLMAGVAAEAERRAPAFAG